MKILIPTPLRQHVGKSDAVEVAASTVGEALAKFVAQHPGLKSHLYTGSGN